MKCIRCNEHEAIYIVEYKDSFYPEEICEFCLDKDGEDIEVVFE